jgi:hypothetical protein
VTGQARKPVTLLHASGYFPGRPVIGTATTLNGVSRLMRKRPSGQGWGHVLVGTQDALDAMGAYFSPIGELLLRVEDDLYVRCEVEE